LCDRSPLNSYYEISPLVWSRIRVFALGNGALSVWTWSTIALKSALGTEAYPFQRYWHRPYGPRLALIVFVIVAGIPAVYCRSP
jgi:hypothetical protein